MNEEAAIRLEARGLTKNYGETSALTGLNLQARAGEILGIAGPNGAGKSTLIRLIAAEEREDDGEILLAGNRWLPRERQRQVAVVHQEPRGFPTLTVAENLVVGTHQQGLRRPIPGETEDAILAQFGLAKFRDRPLETCSLVIQQLVEIGRAIALDARALLLDEPNSALTTKESAQLFEHVTRLREEGSCIVILVSHRFRDLVRHCDRVVVLRDGAADVELFGQQLTSAAISQAVLGRFDVRAASPLELREPDLANDIRPVEAAKPATNAFEDTTSSLVKIRNWRDGAGTSFSAVELEIGRGESLFITGQEGSGGRELVESIGGYRAGRGHLEIGGVRIKRNRTGDMTCYVPADRRSAIFANLSVAGNISSRLGRGAIATRSGWLGVRSILRIAKEFVHQLRIRTPSLRHPVSSLSGGNQQKVSVGSAFAKAPELLVVEEPTRGVDALTKTEISRALSSYLENGRAIIGFSPELDEVFLLADTVRVSMNGTLSPSVSVKDLGSLENLAEWVANTEASFVR